MKRLSLLTALFCLICGTLFSQCTDVGLTTETSWATLPPNSLIAQRVTIPNDGIIDQIGVSAAFGSTGSMHVGLYADGGNMPGSLLTEGPVSTYNGANNLYDIDDTFVTAGDYWIAYNNNNNSFGTMYVEANNTTPQLVHYHTLTFGQSMPPVYTSEGSTDYYEAAVWVVLCPGASGCTDASACNYDSTATADDGSCIVPTGCDYCSTPTATFEITNAPNAAMNGIYVWSDNFIDPWGGTHNGAYLQDGGNYFVLTFSHGATGIFDDTYSQYATTADGVYGMVPSEFNYPVTWDNGMTQTAVSSDPGGALVDGDTDNDGVCDVDEVEGCTDSNACNYNSLATDEDGSCVVPTGCDYCEGSGAGTDPLLTFTISNAPDPAANGCYTWEQYHTNPGGQTAPAFVHEDGTFFIFDGAGVFLYDYSNNYLGSTYNYDYNYDYFNDPIPFTYPVSWDNGMQQTAGCAGGTLVDGDTDDDGVCDVDEVSGCTDANACNYNSLATDDDGSCVIPTGCDYCSTPTATFEITNAPNAAMNGIYVWFDNFIDPWGGTHNGTYLQDGGNYFVLTFSHGATGIFDDTYSQYATTADGVYGMVPSEFNYPVTWDNGMTQTAISSDPGGALVDGDTDDDGVCDVDEVEGCTDSNACNYNSLATDEDGSCVVPTGCDYCEGSGAGTDPLLSFTISNAPDPAANGCYTWEQYHTNPGGQTAPAFVHEDGTFFIFDGAGVFLYDYSNNYLGSTYNYDYNYDYFNDPIPFTYPVSWDNGMQQTAGCAGGTLVDGDTDDDGVCDADEIAGCDDASACNYDPNATENDGSCNYDDNDGDGLCDDVDPDDDNDGCLDTEDPSPLSYSSDYDGDGIADDCDDDIDGDNVSNVADNDPYNPYSCSDTDNDGCDDCGYSGYFDPANDGPDNDGDGLCDDGDPDDDNDGCLDNDDYDQFTYSDDTDGDGIHDDCDEDDDNDGVLDYDDYDPLNPYVCGDSDSDGCDDCINGVDGYGPLVDSDPLNDGPDNDGDGECDDYDYDDDNDGCDDSSDDNPYTWSADYDGDGDADDCDYDDDNDGVDDAYDLDPLNEFVCEDNDGDGCDDCSQTGYRDEYNDGSDYDNDGICDAGDLDDDNDGVDDQFDTDPLNEYICQDSDGDGCDDCSEYGYFDPNNDGPDNDYDGICDYGDPDDDNDGCLDVDDPNPYYDAGDYDGDGIADDCDDDIDGDNVLNENDNDPYNPYSCSDIDNDGCDDCNYNGNFDPANDGFDTDGDGLCDDGDDDDDNDGCLDHEDYDPYTYSSDTDGDGIHDDCDEDDDNDGVADYEDYEPLNPYVCGDSDSDGCDDCSNGVDGFGPLVDSDPMNDGPDNDGDGECDDYDYDDDNDGCDDSNDDNPYTWSADYDGDGDADDCDYDDDNDGVDDAYDLDPLNAFICEDNDGDGCDDCSQSGYRDEYNDGSDYDNDGICDSGDSDDDNDGVDDQFDSNPLNEFECQDSDGDGCDDCSENGYADPYNDGSDADGDGICDSGEIVGCTDPSACNYNSMATDSGSCDYAMGCDTCSGETDGTGYVIDNDADDDGVCDADEIFGCVEPFACNYDSAATENDGSCEYVSCAGCDDASACNYDSSALLNDGSCIYASGCETCSGETDGTGVVVDNDADNDGVCDADEVVGCQDANACNFNSAATDAGSCVYPMACETCSGETDGTGVVVDNDADNDGVCDADEVPGCTDSTANNYNPLATDDDGSCSYAVYGCIDASACNYNMAADTDDGTCVYASGCDYCSGETDGTGVVVDGDSNNNGTCDSDEGCTYVMACNYNAAAILDDGSCVFPGCDDPNAINYDVNAGCDDGSCLYPGCTYPDALNFDSNANYDDGQCEFTSVAYLPGDMNDDCTVNSADLLLFLGAFGNTCAQ